MTEYAFTRVCSDEDEDWLRHRHGKVNGSESAAVLGESPWMTYERVLSEKSTPFDKRVPFVPTRRMRWGKYAETHSNGEIAASLFGLTFIPCNSYLVSNRFPNLGSTIDGVVVASDSMALEEYDMVEALTSVDIEEWRDFFPYTLDDAAVMTTMSRARVDALRAEIESLTGVGLMELKQTGARNTKEWEKGVPRWYFIQVQQQLACSGLEWCIVFARIGAADYRAHVVYRDEALIEYISEAADRLMERVNERKY